ncbi:SUMO E1-like activator enzyme Fub2 [Schizosaccharomyces cryophilus OY26]|uniref:Ubiquitin-activating enzyme E1-like n=1 Tax=Schizosaccharomyces cryophilus (strain OY26 / ATCC MYA-4695 / CBS 11777 / NBRC 106824 / NRRL Y48691) TaxID=653667 RepID=S9W2I9_SCHCR|nr:SUMO E1-like activator enzyme Fub2 [Schizosaccharomyces cryophilus OY26]EPY54243.1 SUMO E1-like activator enzyme Fub2 [Schizosaccharomyces cryophilus OY26]
MSEISNKVSFGEALKRFQDSKVLLVGAGGIGCELLKNLLMSNVKEICIIDLDTIDLSNLNRQFLFRKHHVKQSKAIVAMKTAQSFNPNVKIEAIQANIKEPQFNVRWFRQFGIVFNALDNLDARRHVNKLCLLAEVPLVESGTTGFLGQVQVIVHGKTECYDCNPKEQPKVYPVCTIRSTPSQTIHCIVWAKSYFFPQLFGDDEGNDDRIQNVAQNEAQKKEVEELARETRELAELRKSLVTDSNAFDKIFEKIYFKDIARLRAVPDMWTYRTPPTVLDINELGQKASHLSSPWLDEQKVWTLEENFSVLKSSIQRLSKRLKHSGSEGLSFDKDDKDTMDFVAASANLRAYSFGIEQNSEFDIKQMAGNIIPAIATTNAVIAGLCVTEALKVYQHNSDELKNVFMAKRADRVFHGEKICGPNPYCPTCAFKHLKLPVDQNRMLLKDLVKCFLQDFLHYSEEVSVLKEDLIYDVDFDDNSNSTLADLGISGEKNTILTILGEERSDNEETMDSQSLTRIPLLLEIITMEHTDPSCTPFRLPSEAIVIPLKPEPLQSASDTEKEMVDTMEVEDVSEVMPSEKEIIDIEVIEGEDVPKPSTVEPRASSLKRKPSIGDKTDTKKKPKN